MHEKKKEKDLNDKAKDTIQHNVDLLILKCVFFLIKKSCYTWFLAIDLYVCGLYANQLLYSAVAMK